MVSAPRQHFIAAVPVSAKRRGQVKCQRNRYTYFPWTPGPFDFCSVVVSWNQAVLIRSVSCRPSCQGSNCDPSDLYQARAECKRKMKENSGQAFSYEECLTSETKMGHDLCPLHNEILNLSTYTCNYMLQITYMMHTSSCPSVTLVLLS